MFKEAVTKTLMIFFVSASSVFAQPPTPIDRTCDNPGLFADKMVCGTRILQQLDDSVIATYKDIVTKIPSVNRLQVQWVKEIRNRCESVECLIDAYKSQNETLRQLRSELEAKAKVEETTEVTSPARVADVSPNSETLDKPGVEKSAKGFLSEARAPPSSAPFAEVSGATREPIPKQRLAEPQNSSINVVQSVSKATISSSGRDWSWLWILAILIAAGVVWNSVFRMRCPKCGSTEVCVTGENEVTRWRTPKRVFDKTTRGTKTTHVQTTMAKIERTYECKTCAYGWTSTSREEL